MTNIQYVLKLKKGYVEIEVQGDKKFVEKKFEELSRLSGIVLSRSKLAETELPVVPTITEKVSESPLYKYLGGKTLKFHPDRILAIAGYLRDKEGKKTFTSTEVGSIWPKILKKPNNLSFYFARMAKDGLVKPVQKGGRGKRTIWKISAKGLKRLKKLSK